MERQAALLGAVQLAVQADMARTYFLLRELDSELALYRDTVNLREQAVRFTERQHRAGAATDGAVAQAQTELAATRAERVALQRQRALAEHALALLLGKAPADFDLPAVGPTAGQGPLRLTVPAGLPSALLERRPDIAAAERAMAAENARIGVARAAFFPSLSLTGGVGYESSALGHLSNWSQRTFLLGPLAGTALSLPIFDGGRRDADLAQARALYAERVAQYRQTVLAAFREVEDGLASLRTLDEQAVLQQGAAKASSRAADLARARYRDGDADYLNVIDAEGSSLQQARQVLRVEGERARNTVELMRALGGGWDAQALANATPAGAAPDRP